jgi:hypothetical protein
VLVWQRTVPGKAAEEDAGRLKVGGRAAPKHSLHERSVRSEERDRDMEAVKI